MLSRACCSAATSTLLRRFLEPRCPLAVSGCWGCLATNLPFRACMGSSKRLTRAASTTADLPPPTPPAVARTRRTKSAAALPALSAAAAAAVADPSPVVVQGIATAVSLPVGLGQEGSDGPLLCLGPLTGGILIKRPSATCKTPYVADVQLDDEEGGEGTGRMVMAHAAGMDGAGMVMPGARVFMTSNVTKEDGTTTTRTSHTIQVVQDVRDSMGSVALVGYAPSLAERLTKAAVGRGLLASRLGQHERVETQKTFGGTRVDFVLHHADGSRTLLEVKNVMGADFMEGCVPDGRPEVGCYISPAPTDGTSWAPTAIFPHGKPKPGTKVVSDRAIKHVHELTLLATTPQDVPTRCAVLFVVNRSDCQAFRPCDESDPLFANVVKHAQQQGVQVLAQDMTLDVDTGDVCWGKALPVVFRSGVTGVVDTEHLAKVLHFNQNDPQKNWKARKAREAREQALPSTPPPVAMKTTGSKRRRSNTSKKRQDTSSEEESSDSTTSDGDDRSS